MSGSVIKINPAKKTDLDFEVNVVTNCAEDTPCVRFSIELVEEQQWLSLVCIKDDDTKRWKASIPPLTPIVDRPEYPFVLEVIVEDYYFVPAKGILEPVQSPSVDLNQQQKPSVDVTFDTEEKKDKKKDKKKKPHKKKLARAAARAKAAGGGGGFKSKPGCAPLKRKKPKHS